MPDVEYKIVNRKDLKVIIRRFSGDVQVEDILHSFNHIRKKLLDDQVIGIVTDFDDSNLRVNLTDLKQVIQYLKSTPDYHKVKLAVIVNTPYKTVLPLFAQAKTKEAVIKPFSSIDAAIGWIFSGW